jgi:integrase
VKRTKRTTVNVHKREDGRWSGELRHVGPRGAVTRKQASGASRGEVLDRLKAARDLLDGGARATSLDDTTTLGAYTDRWVTDVLPATDRGPSTVALYADDVRRYIRGTSLAALPVTDVVPSDVAGLMVALDNRGLGSSVRRRVLTIVRAVLDSAKADGLVVTNAARDVSRAKVVGEDAKAFSPAEVALILEATTEDRFAALPVFLSATGVRLGEALALRWTDVDLDAGEVRIRGTLVRAKGGGQYVSPGKTERARRTIPLAVDAVKALRAHRVKQATERLAAGTRWAGQDWVFASTVGTASDVRNVGRWFASVLEDLGLDGSSKAFRHGLATVLLGDGERVPVVSALLGHARPSITFDTYSHVLPGANRAAVDRLAALYAAAPAT